MEFSAFQLSRIYSQGWNAAKKLLAEGGADISETHAQKLNPYRDGAGAERWAKGFKEALQGRSGPPPVSRGAGAWRDSAKH